MTEIDCKVVRVINKPCTVIDVYGVLSTLTVTVPENASIEVHNMQYTITIIVRWKEER